MDLPSPYPAVPAPAKGEQVYSPWQESNEWQELTQPKLLVRNLSSQASAPADANGARGQSPLKKKNMPKVTNKFPATPSRALVSKSEAKLKTKAKILAREACSCWFVVCFCLIVGTRGGERGSCFSDANRFGAAVDHCAGTLQKT